MGHIKVKEEAEKIAEYSAKFLKEKYNVNRVYLIGSILSHNFSEHSDIDLVVEGLREDSYFEALAELMMRYFKDIEIDLIPYEDCEEDFKKIIREKGRILIE
ncbi:MAG: nucleotidyltransferase domain-containing protein [candidate division WOR-3 bacterium]|nr:nucleotidyltransferase domain-containing protein [candidate division WOR-3 bacterium]